MKLTLVTLTGADDSVKPIELADMSMKFPFVEWGIFVSLRHQGGFRFPSVEWIKKLLEIDQLMNLSVHMCGAIVTDTLQGFGRAFYHYDTLLSKAQRFQLNFHAEPHSINYSLFQYLLTKYPHEAIFQCDGINDFLLENMPEETKPFCVPLFDRSHGSGVLPEFWPGTDSIKAKRYGYAGGIGPDNILSVLRSIEKVVSGDTEIWVDMEAKLRKDNDSVFSMQKVQQVLEQAEKYYV